MSIAEIKRTNTFLLDDISIRTGNRIKAEDYECIYQAIEGGQRIILTMVEKLLQSDLSKEDIARQIREKRQSLYEVRKNGNHFD